MQQQPLWKLKEEMCAIGKNIWQRGYCAGNEGNHSLRIGPNRVLCTPTGISKGFLVPDDICVVDMEGNQVEANPNGRKRTSEVKVHLAIYKKRPDVNAVIHSHPPHATAFAIAGIPLPAGIHPEAEVFLGVVPLAPYATPSKQDLPDSILPLITKETNSVMMGNHGTVSFTHLGLTDCYYKLEIIDAYCRILLLCKQLGKVNVLTDKQMTELLQVKKAFGIPDARLECSAQGCVTAPNEAFFATFEDTACAQCDDVGNVTSHARPAAAVSTGPDGDPAFEAMVKAITDQIMASA